MNPSKHKANEAVMDPVGLKDYDPNPLLGFIKDIEATDGGNRPAKASPSGKSVIMQGRGSQSQKTRTCPYEYYLMELSRNRGQGVLNLGQRFG